VEQHIIQALDLLENCHRLYLAAPDRLKKLLNQVFFERILLNPAVDEDGRSIIPPPALQTSLKTGRRGGAVVAGGQATTTRDGYKTAKNASSSHGEDAGDQSADSASKSSHGEAQPGLVHTVRCSTISIIDPYSHTNVIGGLAPPLDQLGSKQLRRAAQQAAVVGAASSGGGRSIRSDSGRYSTASHDQPVQRRQPSRHIWPNHGGS